MSWEFSLVLCALTKNTLCCPLVWSMAWAFDVLCVSTAAGRDFDQRWYHHDIRRPVSAGLCWQTYTQRNDAITGFLFLGSVQIWEWGREDTLYDSHCLFTPSPNLQHKSSQCLIRQWPNPLPTGPGQSFSKAASHTVCLSHLKVLINSLHLQAMGTCQF